MKVGRWSNIAGSNNATPPDGWPEGQAPSTVNDCAREMMASIRAAFYDLQYIDQGWTPTFVSVTSFTVPGNQTSAIHAGRRMKLFDTNTLYGTVATASFTTVTTIDLELDSGNLTTSLTSVALSVIANDTTNALPRKTNLSVSALSVTGPMNVSGTAVFSTTVFTKNISVSSDVVCNTLHCSSTAIMAYATAANTPKAYLTFTISAGGVATGSYYNIDTAIRSAVGVVKITFFSALPTLFWVTSSSVFGGAYIESLSATPSTCKFTFRSIQTFAAVDDVGCHIVFFHP